MAEWVADGGASETATAAEHLCPAGVGATRTGGCSRARTDPGRSQGAGMAVFRSRGGTRLRSRARQMTRICSMSSANCSG